MRTILLCLALLVAGVGRAEVKTNVQGAGEIVTAQSIPVKLGERQIKVPVINGFLPNEILECEEKGEVTYRNYKFDQKTPYRDGMKVEYQFNKNGPSITESTEERGVIAEFHTKIYKLR